MEKENAVATLPKTESKIDPKILQSLVLDGDLSKMNSQQKMEYYNMFCHSLGLNHLTQPFQIIKFQGKEKLYATKDCTEQLRKLHGVSIIELTSQELRGVFVVTAKAQDSTGKIDAATGAVTIEGLKGDALANALMKAETKSKRRVTLSICGLGILDESETDTMPPHTTVAITTPIQLNEREQKHPEEKVYNAEPIASNGKVTPNAKAEDKPRGADTRAWLSEQQFEKAKVRIEQGETELYPKLKEEFRMKRVYREELEKLHEFSKTVKRDDVPTHVSVQPIVEISEDQKKAVEHAFLLCEDAIELEGEYNKYTEYFTQQWFIDYYENTRKKLLKPIKK